MSFNHRAFLIVLSLPLLGVVCPLHAGDPALDLARLPWTTLLESPPDGVAIKYRIVNTADGYAVAFRNDGAIATHFGFWINGWQDKDKALTNGRIHLAPGEESSAVSVAVRIPGRPPAANAPLNLLHITLGEDGQGLAWRE